MSEDQFISKQAAMQIAHDLQISVDGYHMYNQAINNYCAEIGSMKEAIVRCKDCQKWLKNPNSWMNQSVCDVWDDYTNPYDFCSYGERRTDGCD